MWSAWPDTAVSFALLCFQLLWLFLSNRRNKGSVMICLKLLLCTLAFSASSGLWHIFFFKNRPPFLLEPIWNSVATGFCCPYFSFLNQKYVTSKAILFGCIFHLLILNGLKTTACQAKSFIGLQRIKIFSWILIEFAPSFKMLRRKRTCYFFTWPWFCRLFKLGFHKDANKFKEWVKTFFKCDKFKFVSPAD